MDFIAVPIKTRRNGNKNQKRDFIFGTRTHAFEGQRAGDDRKTLTLDGARKAMAASVVEAHKNNEGGVIAVVDEGGNLMALERIDESFAAGANISIGKARTAALFNKPTKFFEDVIAKGRTAMVALDDFTPLQGGVPIVVDGQMVGAVGVSRAANAQQDEHLAVTGASAVSSAPASVKYFKSDEVTSAFAKGAVLFDGSDKYMVHASRRENSGPGGIWILSPEGKHLGTIVAPMHPHNFNWGDEDGKTLYLCAQSGLYRMRVNVAGFGLSSRVPCGRVES